MSGAIRPDSPWSHIPSAKAELGVLPMRLEGGLERCFVPVADAQKGEIHEPSLAELEAKDNLFPDGDDATDARRRPLNGGSPHGRPDS